MILIIAHNHFFLYLFQQSEPLLTKELYFNWISGLGIEDHNIQLNFYKSLIARLPQNRRKTLCKLLGHLHTVQYKSEKNLMPVSNLAAIWGPTLMAV